jgi:hypothetical protein
MRGSFSSILQVSLARMEFDTLRQKLYVSIRVVNSKLSLAAWHDGHKDLQANWQVGEHWHVDITYVVHLMYRGV